jgi:hypothetical protein
MTETTDTPDRQKKKGAIPVYATLASLFVICLIYTGIVNDDFWDSVSDSPGYFLGLLMASLLILLPVSAVVGFIAWFIVQKIKEDRFGFGIFWVGSLVVVVGFLYGGKVYMEKAEDLEWERNLAASKVGSGDLPKIELFDGTMRWAYSYGGSETHTMDRVEGRIRNNLSRPLSSIQIRVVILNGGDEIIETFDFTQSWTKQHTYGTDPLLPGHARGFSYSKRIERIPKDMKWQWGVIGARYTFD